MTKLVKSIFLCTCLFLGCKDAQDKSESERIGTEVNVVGALRNVMQLGKLDDMIYLDTIRDRTGLYGLGPYSHLGGELLILDGRSFVSRISSDSTLQVHESYEVSAPFFVYTTVHEWIESDLPVTVKTIKDMERHLDSITTDLKRPFAFKLTGKVTHADFHVQNLPKGIQLSSPEEAHQGQTNYTAKDREVVILGFFSIDHQGIFTHHDSFVHMHLLTKDEKMMGHLDKLEIDQMKLYIQQNIP
ncbi:MAG: acetolactate decarboxylase [Bacteroidia bacterium]|nr:acetolactate decarboxylase [Bacteroidia bacterium]